MNHFAQLIKKNEGIFGIKEKKNLEYKIEVENNNVGGSDLLEVKGIGRATVKILFDNGIRNEAELIKAGKDKALEIFGGKNDKLIQSHIKYFFETILPSKTESKTESE